MLHFPFVSPPLSPLSASDPSAAGGFNLTVLFQKLFTEACRRPSSCSAIAKKLFHPPAKFVDAKSARTRVWANSQIINRVQSWKPVPGFGDVIPAKHKPKSASPRGRLVRDGQIPMWVHVFFLLPTNNVVLSAARGFFDAHFNSYSSFSPGFCRVLLFWSSKQSKSSPRRQTGCPASPRLTALPPSWPLLLLMRDLWSRWLHFCTYFQKVPKFKQCQASQVLEYWHEFFREGLDLFAFFKPYFRCKSTIYKQNSCWKASYP